MTHTTYTSRNTLAYRIRNANAQSVPASQSNFQALGMFSFDALDVHSITHGTAAHRKISVPPHGWVNNSGMETAITIAAHFQSGRVRPSPINDCASRAQPHHPSIVAAAPSTLRVI